jgi:hypothetical protein
VPAEGRLARAVVALGVAVGLTTGGLLAVVLALDVPPPATTTRVLAALAAAGLVAASSGTLRPSVLLGNLRAGTPAVVVGTAAGGLGLAVGGPRLATAVGGTGRTISLLAPVVAVALVAAVVVLGRRRPVRGVVALHPTAAVSGVLAAFLAASAATSLLELPDAYPLSRYPMYSSPRGEGYELDQVAFTGVREDGSERTLGRSLSRNALLRLVAEEDHEALEGFARSEAARDERIVEVLVELQTIAVTEHPDPPGFEVVASEPVLTVAVP